MSNTHSQLPMMVRQADIAIAKPSESNPLKVYLAPPRLFPSPIIA